MKHLALTCILFCLALTGLCQFVPQPLNYPGVGYWPYYYAITDPDHVWIGTFHENGLPCPFSVKTSDGGESWIFDTIPVPGIPQCVSVCGWDANTGFFVFADSDGSTDPSIWKTTDGGTNWSNMITTQFTGSFINFYHAFSADSGLAAGDPRDGYFEIQLTHDGGTTWSRVPSSDIPDILPDEMGLNHSYSGVGNSVWFTTSKARLFRSADRGLTWEATELVPNSSLDLGVCFSTAQHGAVWNRSVNTNQLFITNDGGVTLEPVSFPAGYYIMDMSCVQGIDGGFVITAYKNSMRVYFTPDMFSNLSIIKSSILSNGAVEFYDEATGWLGGGESGYNEIYKYTGILTSTNETLTEHARLTIIPNPSDAEALLRLPQNGNLKFTGLRVTDLTGKVIDSRSVRSSGGWIKLDASALINGVYILEVLSGNKPSGRAKWIVNH